MVLKSRALKRNLEFSVLLSILTGVDYGSLLETNLINRDRSELESTC